MVSTRYGEVIAEALSLTKSVFKTTNGLSVSWLSVECSKLAVRRVFFSFLLLLGGLLTIELFRFFSSAILEDVRKDAYF